MNVLAKVATLPFMSAVPKTRLRELKEARGLTSAQLSVRSSIDPSTLSKIENGKRGVSQNFVSALAEALQVNTGELYASVGSPIPDVPIESALPARGNVRLAPNAPDISIFANLPRDIPVFGTAEAGAEGAFVINLLGGPIEWALRGPGLAGMGQVFAIYVEGESMIPWRKPGQLVYVHESRPAAPGCHAVVELEAGPGEPPRAIIKELVRRTESKLYLAQHNPPSTVEVERRLVRRILRVIEWEEIMGV